MGESEILSPLESGVNSWFYSVLSIGGIRHSESLRIGVNSQFYSVLSDGVIRNSESFRIWFKYWFYSVLSIGGGGGTEILSPSESV